MIQTWTLDVQQLIPGGAVLDMAYVGDKGDHLQAFLHDPEPGQPHRPGRGAVLEVSIDNGQAILPAPGRRRSPHLTRALAEASRRRCRPFPQYSNAQVDSVTMSDPFGSYTYNALQVQVQKRYSKGLTRSCELHLVQEHYQCGLRISSAGGVGGQRYVRRAEHLQPEGGKSGEPVRHAAARGAELYLRAAFRQRQAVCEQGGVPTRL